MLLSLCSKVLKVKPQCCPHQDVHADIDEPQLQSYRDIPNDPQLPNQEVARLHSLELNQGEPDEICFHVSTDVHDMYEPEESVDTTDFKKNLSSPPTNEMTDDAAGYLTRATYRYNREMDEMGYNQEKRDLSCFADPDIAELEGCALYGNTSLETALHYDQMEDIEGEIIEEVDYQNVTIVRTQFAQASLESEDVAGGHTHSCSDDYVSVGGDSGDEDMEGNSHTLGVNFSEGACHRNIHQDTTSFKSSQSYENFDPHQHRASTKALGHKMQEDVHAFTSESSQHDTDNDLYMNVPSQTLASSAAATCADEVYQNLDPRLYKHKHY